MKAILVGVALSAACAGSALSAENGGAPAQYDAMIARHAQANGVPEQLVRRIIVRESRYNPKARNGPYWGMMQLSLATARVAGFRGSPTALLDPETNIAYGVRYLAGAYKTAGGNHDRAVGFYARGYYYAAKSKGLLASIGMGRDGKLTAPSFSAVPVIASAPAAAPAPTVQVASNAAPAQMAATAQAQPRAPIPLPPIRGAAPAPAAGPTLAAATTAIPLPPVRGPSLQPQVAQAGPGPRAIDPKAATPVMASIVPVPRPREEPTVTGSIQPRAAVKGASPLPQPAPVAAGGPGVPLPTPRDSGAKPGAPAPALAYAEPARAAAPIPQPRTAPPPLRR